ncbi:MAG: DUF6452 family protein [Weeksellaceae bacterium]|jgi:hypothetical protein|nr:DUF6452 family protein [Weeksellaceae bacterium]MDX9705213.1 DUF6452 family protein [Weeksellaceae bacterium]
MKNYFLLIGLLFGSVFFVSCEDDDVCIGEATPAMTVVFRNILNMENQSDTLTIYASPDLNFENSILLYEKIFTDSLKLPLGSLAQSQTYFKIQRRSNEVSDILKVDYQTHSEYVSKACGFRLTYENLNFETTQNHIQYLIPGESNQLKNESKTNLYIILGN